MRIVSFMSSGVTSNVKTPNLLNYSGNLVVHLANPTSVTPYVTGGVGGLTVFDRATLGISNTDTFLTGNVGAGVFKHLANNRILLTERLGLELAVKKIVVRDFAKAESFRKVDRDEITGVVPATTGSSSSDEFVAIACLR